MASLSLIITASADKRANFLKANSPAAKRTAPSPGVGRRRLEEKRVAMKKEIRAEMEKIAAEEFDFAYEAAGAADDAAKALVKSLRDNIEARLAESLPEWLAERVGGDSDIMDSDQDAAGPGPGEP